MRLSARTQLLHGRHGMLRCPPSPSLREPASKARRCRPPHAVPSKTTSADTGRTAPPDTPPDAARAGSNGGASSSDRSSSGSTHGAQSTLHKDTAPHGSSGAEGGDAKARTVDVGAGAPQEVKEAVKQKLDPLSSFDERERQASTLLPQDELEKVPIVRNVAYRSPRCHRRRPGNSLVLAARNFIVELKGIITDTLEGVAKPEEPSLPEAFGFTLSNEAIHEFDVEHPPPGREPVPAFIQVAYDVLLFFVDRVYEGKAIERFWFLETVARMPYFAYTTCLHLYETMGWWRTGGLRVVHFAEEWNELHHLLIMEALGGDRRWRDRFLGQHAAVFYYWALVVCFILSPKWSYKFSEMLETHAVSTYRQFIVENGRQLKRLPAPKIAQQYYLNDDPYLFNMDSALVRGPTAAPPRTPPCESLYDVFANILEDEWEHVKTMVMCQDYDLMESLRVTQTDFACGASREGARRELWNQWARDINDMDDMIEMRKM